jgi:hypothetical protein
MTTEHGRPFKPMRMKMIRRLLLSLPLMCLVGVCLFGFVATYDPMPTLERWIWRALYLGAGSASVLTICWMWLRPRRPKMT